MLKVTKATRKSMPHFQGPIIWETLDLSQISRPNLKKLKCYLNKCIDWKHILELNISCHGTFNLVYTFNMSRAAQKVSLGHQDTKKQGLAQTKKKIPYLGAMTFYFMFTYSRASIYQVQSHSPSVPRTLWNDDSRAANRNRYNSTTILLRRLNSFLIN